MRKSSYLKSKGKLYDVPMEGGKPDFDMRIIEGMIGIFQDVRIDWTAEELQRIKAVKAARNEKQ
jgi:hypothetical protein